MLIVNYTPPKWRKKASLYLPLPTPPAERPVLMGASFDENAPSLRLTFDQDVGVGGLVESAITLADNTFTGLHYVVTADTDRPDGRTIVFMLVEDGGVQGEGVLLSADANNGIAAVAGGLTWEGVQGVELPYEQMAATKTKKTRRKRAA